MNLNKLNNSFSINTLKNSNATNNSKLFKSISEDNILNSTINMPIYVNHRSITTKPEDQGSTGTCAMYTSTTVVEMLLWKFLGECEEFSYDEIMNIYLDVQSGYDDTLYTTAYDRYILRGTDGQWSAISNSQYDNGEYTRFKGTDGKLSDGLGLITRNLNFDTRGKDSYLKYRAYYWIMRYNDPAVRINHYPDKFSEICFKAKNYIIDNIYRYASSTSTIAPEKVKRLTFLSQNPMRVGITGSGGHATTMLAYVDEPGYDYGQYSSYHAVFLNSSWDDETYYILKFPFNKDHLDDETKDTYYTCRCIVDGVEKGSDSRFSNGVTNIDFFDRKINSSNNSITIVQSEKGKIIGLNTTERIKTGTEIQLLAKPYGGYYFKRWLVNDNIVSNSFDNPMSITVNEDMVIQAEYSSTLVNRKIKLIIPYGKTEKYYGTDDVLDSDIETLFNISITPDTKKKTFDWLYNNIAIAYYYIECDYGQDVELSVSPAINKHQTFISWNDGNENSQRTITLTSDTILYPIYSDYIDMSGCTPAIGSYNTYLNEPTFSKRSNDKSDYYILEYGLSISYHAMIYKKLSNKKTYYLYKYSRNDFDVNVTQENLLNAIDNIKFTVSGGKLIDQSYSLSLANVHRYIYLKLWAYDDEQKMLLGSLNDCIKFSSDIAFNKYSSYLEWYGNRSINIGDIFTSLYSDAGFMLGDIELNENVVINYTTTNGATVNSCELYQGYYHKFGTPDASCTPTLTNGCISFKMTEKPSGDSMTDVYFNSELFLIVHVTLPKNTSSSSQTNKESESVNIENRMLINKIKNYVDQCNVYSGSEEEIENKKLQLCHTMYNGIMIKKQQQ